MNWFVWRVVISDRIGLSLREARRASFVEIFDAHLVLDAIDDVRAEETAKLKREKKGA